MYLQLKCHLRLNIRKERNKQKIPQDVYLEVLMPWKTHEQCRSANGKKTLKCEANVKTPCIALGM